MAGRCSRERGLIHGFEMVHKMLLHGIARCGGSQVQSPIWRFILARERRPRVVMD